MTEDELMRELEKDIDAPDMFSIDYVKPDKQFLNVGHVNIELDTRTSQQKSKAKYYKKMKMKQQLNDNDIFDYDDEILSVGHVKPINYDIRVENGYLCIGEFRIELDNRTPLQKAKSRYYFKKKSNGI
tara:strand:+ start:349 stop:732 length:384 start_codon:yes stop_codon:yes gene_type:complete